jgi:hypothetical protein
MYVICIAVRHKENCVESAQCNYANETVCENNTCKCEANLEYDGRQCIGKFGMYVYHVSYIQKG